MRRVHGEQYAQVDNADPFAPVVWRSPVHRTPEWMIWLVQLIRLLWRVTWFFIRHPLLDVAAGVLYLAWYQAGWPGEQAWPHDPHNGQHPGWSRSRPGAGGAGGGVTGAAGTR